YDHRQANRLSYRVIRRLFPVENVAWTVQSQEELEKARKIFQCFIFDSFIPDSETDNKQA
ncbi:MAG: glycerophosphodiester phosphodiesterase, partial [Clostridia bacterium]|nr:glycerophosphodiester phosphodiesterase [Clostridia bacterium]